MLSRFVLGLGSTLITAAAGAYLLWGPSKKRQKDQCPGLENTGNTCFLNSLLQSWAACPSLYKWLKSSLSSEASKGSTLLTRTIFKVLRVLNNEDEEALDPYNPGEVLFALRARGWIITGEEQDAHELFHVLTETLDEEMARYPSVLSLFDGRNIQDPENMYQTKTEAVTRSGSLLPILPARTIEQPTRGLLASQLHCMSCGARCPVKYDVFDSLTLNLPKNFWGALSLNGLLQKLISPEMVQDVECNGCAKMLGQKTAKSTFQKRVSIGKLPQVLCLHISRNQWMNNGAVVKRYDHVSFPEMLCMDQFLYNKQATNLSDNSMPGLMGGCADMMQMLGHQRRPTGAPNSGPVNLLRTLNFDQQITQTGFFLHPQQSPQIPRELSDINHNAPPDVLKSNSADFSYKLAAVVCHLGDAQLGHFVSYRRGPPFVSMEKRGGGDISPKWWLTSDTSVRRVSKQQVLSSEAYMLFYERV